MARTAGRRCIILDAEDPERSRGWHDLAHQDRVEAMRFTAFLRCHGAAGAAGPAGPWRCSCGQPSVRKLPDETYEAVRNDACDCPCHEPGYLGLDGRRSEA